MADYTDLVSVDEAVMAGVNDTLCWDCRKAMTKGSCCWTDPEEQKPVPGWVATETDMGYRVITCPNFERCSWGGARYRTAEEYIAALEERVVDSKKQIQNLKKTLWWKQVYALRRKNRDMKLQIMEMRERIDELKKEVGKDGSAENSVADVYKVSL